MPMRGYNTLIAGSSSLGDVPQRDRTMPVWDSFNQWVEHAVDTLDLIRRIGKENEVRLGHPHGTWICTFEGSAPEDGKEN